LESANRVSAAMHSVLRPFAALAFFSFARLSFAETPSAELMSRLAAHVQASRDLMENARVTIQVKAEELDDAGRVKSAEMSQMKVTRKAGATSTEVLSSSKDGVDTTAAKQKELQAQNGKPVSEKQPGFKVTSPFAASEQGNHAFTMLGPDGENPQFLRIGIAPKDKKGPTIWYGEATVDSARGEVVRVSMRPSQNPTFVSNMAVEMRFDFVSPKGRLMSWMKGQGAGGVLFFKKRMRVQTLFSDYVLGE
jgi:hypothetical protein